MIWGAYVAIPVVLVYFARRKKDLPFRQMFWLFGAFIIACGTTHLMEYITFQTPLYRLAGTIKLFTALVSWGTVLALVPIAPRFFAMRNPEDLEREISARKDAEAGLRLAADELEHRVRARTVELERAIAVLSANQEEMAALNEKLRRAMQETHHRVKNNLQIVGAMLDMQLLDGDAAIPSEEVARVLRQVRAMAVVHETLTHEARADIAAESISARDALGALVPTLREIAPDRFLTLEAEDLRLSAKQCTSLAMLMAELVSNAFKHGAIAVTVRLASHGEQTTFEVADNGPGFPEGFHPVRSANTGLELIESLSRWDLRGEPSYQNLPEGGAAVRVTFATRQETSPEFDAPVGDAA
jgi:two-component sensor histidine kinase